LQVISNIREEKLLSDNTSVIYEQDGHTLPEDYNGLGYLNLFAIIYCIHLKLDAFKREGALDIKPADINLLFIEEPEAHTHPQMQYSFIRNIKAMLADESKGINLHTIISTHSSHIVSQSNFSDIKYFYRDFENNNIIAQNLSELEPLYVKSDSPESEKIEQQRNFQFLKQYLTLERAELFFADKAIFIEGDTERILMSAMMKKIDAANKDNAAYSPLLSQNVSIVEVGAYSHIFAPFLDFLRIKTLVITDLDSVGADGKACCVCDGVKTSNKSLNYFIHKTFEELKTLPHNDKCFKFDSGNLVATNDGELCIAYQTAVVGYHARSFEDAFIATNYDFIKANKDNFTSLKCRELISDKSPDYFDIAQKCINRKTVFATDILYYSDKNLSNWNVPNYIKEGLEWLAR
jgi:predicted ATP-dependent endonuclease of OLD family